ncbi:MAG: fused ferrous iron transport protein A/B, partial [Clostridia bacterium]|nr:fused ferrous iron transport protein A/B [Clostridia bacterium]
MKTICNMKIGEKATVVSIGGEGSLRQHFLDMGIIPNAEVTLIKYAPMGDPIELRLHGYELTLRKEDAAKIQVKDSTGYCVTGLFNNCGNCSACSAACKTIIPKDISSSVRPVVHPGLGEGGRYHIKENENPLPDGTKLTFALAGNQNCGKTTLFNALTGSNQHVGNFPGVTVDRKDGVIRGNKNTLITDLPGIYSMTPYSNEEKVSREFIIKEKPKCIINIVDATNIERNLYLTMQLMEMDTPMVLALNMMDEVSGNGGSIKVNEMESMLGIPVIPISASKGEGIKELIDHAIHVAQYQEKPEQQDFCNIGDKGGAVHRCLHSIMHLIEDHAENANVPLRFAAAKIIEGDVDILEALDLSTNEKETIEHLIMQMEQERGLDRAAAVADMRFSFIEKVCSATVIKPRESREHKRSQKWDRILTGKYTAIPVFIGIMMAIFYLTFNVIGAFLQDVLDSAITNLSDVVCHAMEAVDVNAVIRALVSDGIFAGVGSVISFLPIIVTLFFFLS